MDRSTQDGFTLLEALVAAFLFSMLMVGALTLYATNNEIYTRGRSMAEVHQNTRIALDTMAREIRVAGYDPAGSLAALASATPIQSATPTQIRFVAELTGDGVLDQVTYRVAGRQLLRELASWDGSSFSGTVSGEMAEGIDALSLVYFDGASPANNEIAAPVAAAALGHVRRVTIGLAAEYTTLRATESFSVVTDVVLRN